MYETQQVIFLFSGKTQLQKRWTVFFKVF